MKQFTILIVLGGILFLSGSCFAQKVLSESETVWVEEAKSELNKALTDPEMSESD